MDGATAARQWLVNRIDRQISDSVRSLLSAMAVDLAVAAASAVTVRMLSADGQWLFPVAAHHPDPTIEAAMTAVMDDTAQRTTSGLWGRVCEQRRPVRWHVPPEHIPAEASAAQAEFMRRYPIRAVLGAPLISHGRLLGGAALVRYVVDREFTDDDEAMLCNFGVRAALVLDCLRTVCDVSAHSDERP